MLGWQGNKGDLAQQLMSRDSSRRLGVNTVQSQANLLALDEL
jgi:hypothetical protein